MKVVLSLKGIAGVKKRRQGLNAIQKAGFTDAVADFSQIISPLGLENCDLNNSDDMLPDLSALMGEIYRDCKKTGIGMPVSRAPYLKRTTAREDLNEKLTEITIEAIRTCAGMETEYIIVRPLFSGLSLNEVWEKNMDFYLKLAAEAKKSNVIILLENQSRDVNGHLIRGVCSDPAESSEWIDELNREAGEERFGFCFDLGTCSICGQNPYRVLSVLGDRVKAAIVRDYNNSDISVLPYMSAVPGKAQTDWIDFFRGMRKIDFDGPLIFQISDSLRMLPGVLRNDFLKFTRATTDFFVWQIGMERMLRKYPQRVLFGAGNMCRTYMKNYGDTFRPLFTCDNNPKVWGTEFCGLSVKEPSALLDLPEDCAVIICNIYYNEIEKQLKEMGICNPVERFSDLYMPVFYFDRLEMADVEEMEI